MAEALVVSPDGAINENDSAKMVDESNINASMGRLPTSKTPFSDSPCKPKHRKMLPGSPKLLTSPRKRMKRRKQHREGDACAGKKGVSFNAVIHNRRIPHISESEALAVWITQEEYLKIRKRCAYTVKKMMRNTLTQKDLEDEIHCPRGLEGKTKDGAARRKEHKFDASAAVLEEQSMQIAEGVRDAEALKEVYLIYSRPCQQEAEEKGAEDEIAAKSYLNQPLAYLPPAPSLADSGESLIASAESKNAPGHSDAGAVNTHQQISLHHPAQIPNPLSTMSGISSCAKSLVPTQENDHLSGISSILAFKLRDVFCSRKSHGALMKDIEKNYFDGHTALYLRTAKPIPSVSDEECKECDGDTSESIGTVAALTSQLRNLLIPNQREPSLPGLEPLDSYDEEGSSTTIQNSLVW